MDSQHQRSNTTFYNPSSQNQYQQERTRNNKINNNFIRVQNPVPRPVGTSGSGMSNQRQSIQNAYTAIPNFSGSFNGNQNTNPLIQNSNMDMMLSNDSNSFGIVGNKKDIKVTTANGHRKINSYQAGAHGQIILNPSSTGGAVPNSHFAVAYNENQSFQTLPDAAIRFSPEKSSKLPLPLSTQSAGKKASYIQRRP